MTPLFTLTRRRLLFGLVFFALTITAGAALDRWRNVAVKPVAETRAQQPRNEFVEVLPDGRRMRVFRWPWSPERPPREIVHLRIPNEYIWSGGGFAAGLRSALEPGYDPNDTEPYISSIILEALWPGMEARNGPDDPRFEGGIGGSVIRIGLSPNGGLSRYGDPIIDTHYKNRRQSIDTPIVIRMYGVSFGQKSERYGLQRFGPIKGDFNQFRNGGGVHEIFFPSEDPKQRFIVCPTDQIRDTSEDPSFRARPFCEHFFYSEYRRAVVRLTYRRIYLPEWPLIERKVEELLASFDIQPIDGSSRYSGR